MCLSGQNHSGNMSSLRKFKIRNSYSIRDTEEKKKSKYFLFFPPSLGKAGRQRQNFTRETMRKVVI